MLILTALLLGFMLALVPALAPAAEIASDPDFTIIRDAKAASAEFYFRSQAGRISERLAAIRAEGDRSNRKTMLQMSLNRPIGPWQFRDRKLDASIPAQIVESINLTHLGAGATGWGAVGRAALAAPKAPARWSWWSGGAVNFGASGKDAADTHNIATTFGADYAFGDRLAVGVTAGFSRDWNSIGDAGARLGGEAFSAAMYGSYVLGPGFFVEGMLGGSSFGLDSQKRDGTFLPAVGGRRGEQLFGSVSLGYEYRKKRFTLAPFTRLESAVSRFDANGEAGDAGGMGQYAAVLGATVRRSFSPRWGEVSPSAGLEYAYNFKGGAFLSPEAAARGGGAFSRMAPLTAQGSLAGTFGVDATFKNSFKLGVNYRGVVLPDAEFEQSVLVEGGWSF